MSYFYLHQQMLSRAFRNRFVELHFDELPSQELEVILHQRCSLPLSYAKKLVAIMLDLQVRTSTGKILFHQYSGEVYHFVFRKFIILNDELNSFMSLEDLKEGLRHYFLYKSCFFKYHEHFCLAGV